MSTTELVNGQATATKEIPTEANYGGQGYILRVRGGKRTDEGGGRPVHALRGTALDNRRGNYFPIMGPPVSEKSPLSNMIGGFENPPDGTFFTDEVHTPQLDFFKLAGLRSRKSGYFFQ